MKREGNHPSRPSDGHPAAAIQSASETLDRYPVRGRVGFVYRPLQSIFGHLRNPGGEASCLSTFPLLQCKRANPRRLTLRRCSRRLSTASGCPEGIGGGGELRFRRPVYSFQLSRSRLGLGSGGSVSSSASALDEAFCLLGVGSGDGAGGFCFGGCGAGCSADGRRGSCFDLGDVGVSSFLFSGDGCKGRR